MLNLQIHITRSGPYCLTRTAQFNSNVLNMPSLIFLTQKSVFFGQPTPLPTRNQGAIQQVKSQYALIPFNGMPHKGQYRLQRTFHLRLALQMPGPQWVILSKGLRPFFSLIRGAAKKSLKFIQRGFTWFRLPNRNKDGTPFGWRRHRYTALPFDKTGCPSCITWFNSCQVYLAAIIFRQYNSQKSVGIPILYHAIGAQ